MTEKDKYVAAGLCQTACIIYEDNSMQILPGVLNHISYVGPAIGNFGNARQKRHIWNMHRSYEFWYEIRNRVLLH